MLLLVSVYLIFIWFNCCPLFPPCVFLFVCVVSHWLSLPLSSCLSCIPLLIGLPFLRSLLRRMLFSCPTRITWSSLFLLLLLWLVFLVSCLILFHCFCLFCAPSWRRCILLATFLPVSFCLLSLTGETKKTNQRLAGLQLHVQQPRFTAMADVKQNITTCERQENFITDEGLGDILSVWVDDNSISQTSFGVSAEHSKASEKNIGDALVDEGAECISRP